MSRASTRIAIVKPEPDYGIRGGFESVVDHVKIGLESHGFQVGFETLDLRAGFASVFDHLKAGFRGGGVHMGCEPSHSEHTMPTIYGVAIPPESLAAMPEFFSYMACVEAFEQMDVSGYDLVISTQPPAFAIDHPRHISLFYHHLKIAYDLYDLIQETELFNLSILRLGADIIRETDQFFLNKVSFFLAGSEAVKNRLAQFNHVEDNVVVFQAGIDKRFYNFSGSVSYEVPTCVGRHEFPKRPELFIHAMKHLPDLKGLLIGSGGFTRALFDADRYLAHAHKDGGEIDDHVLWKRTMFTLRKSADVNDSKPDYDSNVSFLGRVADDGLARAYQRALCVVCPAYGEDFGLTALEAMAFRKPVIVCRDGGGYVELVEQGVNGFIVEPSGAAIAQAIRCLAEDPDQARRMGEAGYERSRQFSWDNATQAMTGAVRRVLDESMAGGMSVK